MTAQQALDSLGVIVNSVIGKCHACQHFSYDCDPDNLDWLGNPRGYPSMTKRWNGLWWKHVDTVRLQRYPQWFIKHYRRKKREYRRHHCHVCQRTFTPDELESRRAYTFVVENGGDGKAVFEIGGRRCVACLVDHINAFAPYVAWLEREDGNCAGETFLLPIDNGLKHELQPGDHFGVGVVQGHESICLVRNNGGPIAYVAKRWTNRLLPELKAGLSWRATINRYGLKLEQREAQIYRLLLDAGFIPEDKAQEARAKSMARKAYAQLDFNTRWFVLSRDKMACFYCGHRPHDAGVLVIDHLVPRGAGGSDELSNLVAGCNPCNAGKADKILDDKLLRQLQDEINRRNIEKFIKERQDDPLRARSWI